MSRFLLCTALVWSTLFVDWSLYLDPQFYCRARNTCPDVYCDRSHYASYRSIVYVYCNEIRQTYASLNDGDTF